MLIFVISATVATSEITQVFRDFLMIIGFMKPSDANLSSMNVWWKTKTTHVNEKIFDWVTAKLATAGSPSNLACLLAWPEPGLDCSAFPVCYNLSWGPDRPSTFTSGERKGTAFISSVTCSCFPSIEFEPPACGVSANFVARLCSEQTFWLWFGVFSKYAPPPPIFLERNAPWTAKWSQQ